MAYFRLLIKTLFISLAFGTMALVILAPFVTWRALTYMGDDMLRYIWTWVSLLSTLFFICIPSMITVCVYLEEEGLLHAALDKNKNITNDNYELRKKIEKLEKQLKELKAVPKLPDFGTGMFTSSWKEERTEQQTETKS